MSEGEIEMDMTTTEKLQTCLDYCTATTGCKSVIWCDYKSWGTPVTECKLTNIGEKEGKLDVASHKALCTSYYQVISGNYLNSTLFSTAKCW